MRQLKLQIEPLRCPKSEFLLATRRKYHGEYYKWGSSHCIEFIFELRAEVDRFGLNQLIHQSQRFSL